MKYVVLDLEMCKVMKYQASSFPIKNEIIQIGAVKLNEDYEIIDEYSSYVKPQHGKINNFIKNLTGITEYHVKKAADLKNVIDTFLQWIGSEETTFIAWSNTDYNQLSREMEYNSIICDGKEALLNPEKWIDYQKVFGDRYNFPNPKKLSEALDLADITFEGVMHDGLNDAYNTARLFATLEKDPEYQLITEKYCNKAETEHLSVSFGDLLMQKFNFCVLEDVVEQAVSV